MEETTDNDVATTSFSICVNASMGTSHSRGHILQFIGGISSAQASTKKLCVSRTSSPAFEHDLVMRPTLQAPKQGNTHSSVWSTSTEAGCNLSTTVADLSHVALTLDTYHNKRKADQLQ